MSGFPETGLTSVEVRGTSGKSGKLPGNPGVAVKFHSERTSGEVAEKLPGLGQKLGVAASLTRYQRLANFVSKQR